MKALAAFYYRYNDSEVRVVYENGYLEIKNACTWHEINGHYTFPKKADELIDYMRQAANWIEVEL